MTDGTLAVRRRDPKANEEAAAEAKQAALAGGAYEYFAEMETVFGTGHVKAKGKDLPVAQGPADEFRVESKRKVKLREFDRFLKAFKYGAALDAGLKKVCFCVSSRNAGLTGRPSDQALPLL
jgi:U3 small nucleolar RNA-associated protein 15